MRRIRGKEDGLNAVIAGMVAGLAMIIDGGRRRKLILMAFLVRAVDCLVTLLDKKGIIKKIKHFEVYLFGPMISFLVYLYFYEKAVFPPGIDRAFKATARPTPQELALGSEVYLRQGNIWFPGVAKKLVIK
jgi:hypothetical protein